MNSLEGATEIQRWRAEFHDVQTPVGLRIERISLSGRGARIDSGPFSLSLDRPGDVEAVVHENAVKAFLEERSPGGMRDVSVAVLPNGIHVEATVRVLIDMRAKAVCGLKIVDRTKLYVELLSIEVLGAAPKNLVQRQLDAVNPVLDVGDLPFEAEFEQIELGTGRVTVRGKLWTRGPSS
jgi:hypothetical protein